MSKSDRLSIAAAGAALVLVGAAAWVFVTPEPGQGPETDPPLLLATANAPEASAGGPQLTTIVVDVEGAVAAPGVRELPAGARVADALAAAGGYAPDADLEAAAANINLAERLTDGVQIVVPRAGSQTADSSAGAQALEPDESDRTVNINTASADELEALPGIGPVTVERIIAARRETPFASLDDAVERGVLHRGQREDLEGLATAG